MKGGEEEPFEEDQYHKGVSPANVASRNRRMKVASTRDSRGKDDFGVELDMETSDKYR